MGSVQLGKGRLARAVREVAAAQPAQARRARRRGAPHREPGEHGPCPRRPAHALEPAGRRARGGNSRDPESAARHARAGGAAGRAGRGQGGDRKSTRLNSSHLGISYAVFCLKKKKKKRTNSKEKTTNMNTSYH